MSLLPWHHRLNHNCVESLNFLEQRKYFIWKCHGLKLQHFWESTPLSCIKRFSLEICENDEMMLISPTGHDCFISHCLSCRGFWRECLRVCARRSMCVCVCSQLYWHFLKRGWHFQGIWRLDPFCVWRAVCCPPHSTEGNAAAEPAACPAFRALVYSIWSGPSSFTRSVIRRRPALYIACLLETTGSLLGLFLSLAVFPWGVECFCFSQLRQKSYKQKIWGKKVDRDSVGGSERERKQECVMERGRDPFLLLQAG